MLIAGIRKSSSSLSLSYPAAIQRYFGGRQRERRRGLGRRKSQTPTPLAICRGPEFNADPFGGTSFDSMSFNGVSFDAVLFVVVGLNWVAD